MKKTIALFAFIILAATAHSQSLTETDISGVWKITNVENGHIDPELAAKMQYAFLYFHNDKSFELKEKGNDPANPLTTTSHKNARWSYNAPAQTLTTTRTKMTLKVSTSNNKIFFTDTESGLKFEVIKPS